MNSNLPLHPMKSVRIPIGLRIIISVIHVAADIFGFWKKPFGSVTANFEDIALFDKIYWTYKSIKRVVKPEDSFPVKISTKVILSCKK